MKIQKYICTNILSLLGNIILLYFLLFIFDLNWFDFILKHIDLYFLFDVFANLIVLIFILLGVEILIVKICHRKFIIKIQIKNKIVEQIYNNLFWIGLVCSIFYFLFYIFVVILLNNPM